MVLKESVFLVNVLCSLVPCDVKHPYPDTSSDPDSLKLHFKIEYDGPSAWQNQYFAHPVAFPQAGKMEGYFMTVVGGRKIFAFEGIPYAIPPLGNLRFRAPVAKPPWKGVLQADTKGPDCLQYNMKKIFRVLGKEDCLYINVYSPQVPYESHNNITKLPVLVWFHGGGFLHGSGSDAGPSYLLQKDVILVTVNYRLGVLGFLSTGDAASPGNFGLKDQALSLEWVNRNIESFGGNPALVTIMGQGSGGASVHLQMISPRARNLFQAAIAQSGTAFNYWSVHLPVEAKNVTYHLADMMNCPVQNGSEILVHCLREMDAFDLVQYQIPLLDDWFAPVILFRPTIEYGDQYEPPFLTESPEEAYKNNNVAKVPFIASITAEEGLTFLLLHAVVGSIKTLRQDWKELAPDFLDYEHFAIDTDEVTRRVNWFYLKQFNSETAPMRAFGDMIRDRFILGGVHKALQAHCQVAPTYSYVFAYNGKYNLGTSVGYKSKEWGVGHEEDIYYVLNSTLKYDGFKRKDPELILSTIMVNVITNFAKYGEPLFTTEQGEDIKIWAPIVDPRNMSLLLLANIIKMIPEPFIKNIHFWESLGLPDSYPLELPVMRQFGGVNGQAGHAITGNPNVPVLFNGDKPSPNKNIVPEVPIVNLENQRLNDNAQYEGETPPEIQVYNQVGAVDNNIKPEISVDNNVTPGPNPVNDLREVDPYAQPPAVPPNNYNDAQHPAVQVPQTNYSDEQHPAVPENNYNLNANYENSNTTINGDAARAREITPGNANIPYMMIVNDYTSADLLRPYTGSGTKAEEEIDEGQNIHGNANDSKNTFENQNVNENYNENQSLEGNVDENKKLNENVIGNQILNENYNENQSSEENGSHKLNENYNENQGLEGNVDENKKLNENVIGNPNLNENYNENQSSEENGNHNLNENYNENQGLERNVEENQKLNENVIGNPNSTENYNENQSLEENGNPNLSLNVNEKQNEGEKFNENVNIDQVQTLNDNQSIEENFEEFESLKENKGVNNVNVYPNINGNSLLHDNAVENPNIGMPNPSDTNANSNRDSIIEGNLGSEVDISAIVNNEKRNGNSFSTNISTEANVDVVVTPQTVETEENEISNAVSKEISSAVAPSNLEEEEMQMDSAAIVK